MEDFGKYFNKAINSDKTTLYVPLGEVQWRLPTELPSLDLILGGGIPSGCLTQIYGPPESGKTSLAYRIVAQSVKFGYETLLVSIEDYSKKFAIACGVDVNAPNYHNMAGDVAEEVFNFTVNASRNTNIQVMVVDSIAGAIPKYLLENKQKESELDKGTKMGSKAMVIQTFVEQIKQPLMRKHLILVVVNQVRSDITKFGASVQPTGGKALKFYSNITLSMWGSKNKAEEEIESNVTVGKGKDYDILPFGATKLYFHHGKGVDVNRDVIEVCAKNGIVKKSGSWYEYVDSQGEIHKYQGSRGFSTKLDENQELRDELYTKAMGCEPEEYTPPDETNPSEEGVEG